MIGNFIQCRVHGKVYENGTIKCGTGKRRCAECYKKIRQNNYRKNRQKIQEKNKRWNEKNPERKAELSRIYRKRMKDVSVLPKQEEEKDLFARKKFFLARRRIRNVIISIDRIIRNGNKEYK